MKTTIGFIGCGNLTSALLQGLNNHSYDMSSILVYDINNEKGLYLQEQFGVISEFVLNNLVLTSKIIILCIKPQQYHEVIQLIKQDITDQIIISPAGGLDIDFVSSLFDRKVKLIRVMPNTPSSVNEGITGVAYNEHVTKRNLTLFEDLFNHFGEISYVLESDFDRFTAIYGSGPAFVYLFMEALTTFARANLKDQIHQDKLISQLVRGTALLAAGSTESITTLREEVTSKGGITIEGVNHLLSSDFFSIISETLSKTVKRSEELSKEIKNK
jgi:pyrroline-5-carboxylate reductase